MAKEPKESSKKLNPEIVWLAAIFVMAVVLRMAAVLTREMVLSDETSFLRIAENLLKGQGPYDITGAVSHLGILYPLVTASIAVMTRNITVAGYVVSILFSSLLILPAYMFGKVMWNMRVGRAAAALVAVLPVLVDHGSIIDGQNLFAFWLLSALFFGYRMQFTKRCMCGMLSGTCLGLAYLVDPTALYYLVTLFGLLVIVGLRQELASYANKAAAHFVLMFLLFAIPNIAFMTWQHGSFTLVNRANDQIYAAVHDLAAGTLERESDMFGLTPAGDLRLTELEDGPGLLVSFADSPGDFTEAVARSDYRAFFRNIHSLVPVWLLPLVGLGLFKFAWTRREALKYGYFALAMAPLLLLPVVWGDIRFALPYLGIVMLWVARGWVYLEEWTTETVDDIMGWQGQGSRKGQVQAVLAVLVLVPLAALSFWNVTRAEYPVELKQTGEWLKDADAEGNKVMSRESITAWYSGADQLILPYASVDETLDYAQRNQAEYFVMSRLITDSVRPQLEPLMSPENRYLDRLEPVYHSGERTDSEVIIYRFRR